MEIRDVAFQFLFVTLVAAPLLGQPVGGRPASSQDQLDAGIIEGTVKDANGAEVPKAPVTITETQTNNSFKALTDARGNYVSPPLKVGVYTISVSAPGF